MKRQSTVLGNVEGVEELPQSGFVTFKLVLGHVGAERFQCLVKARKTVLERKELVERCVYTNTLAYIEVVSVKSLNDSLGNV